MLPLPSEEQQECLKIWVDKKNQVCSAAAGSGKSTLLLHACLASTEPVVIAAYNKQLASEMAEKLEEYGITHAQVFTFHGLCSRIFQLTPDDATMHSVIEKAKRGEIHPKASLNARRVLIDEAQDMRDVYFELIKIIFPIEQCQFLIVGDLQQTLYDYDLEDPAISDYMINPQNHFSSSEWAFTRLSVSFRLTPCLAKLANYCLDGPKLVAGNKRNRDINPAIISCTPSNWVKKVPIYVQDALHVQKITPSEIAILVPSVRSSNGNRAVLDLINELTNKGIPLYIHGSDGADPRISKEKVIVSTWHASKGMQYEFTIVVGINEESQHNPLHVALTRSKCEEIVIQDRKRPKRRLVEAVKDERDSLDPDDETESMIERLESWKNSEPPSEETLLLKNLDTWNPRGRCVSLHNLIRCKSQCSMQNSADFESEIVIKGRQSWENVTQMYRRATLMCLEFYATDRCIFVDAMIQPKYIHKNKVLEFIQSSTQARFVQLGITKPQMLPANVHEMLKSIHQKKTRSEVDWLTLATAAESWCGYHHICKRILPANWANYNILKTLCGRVRNWIGSGKQCKFDVLLTAEFEGTQLYSRCDILLNHTAYTVIYEDDISSTSKLRACIPMLLSTEIHECAVINLKNGEMHAYKVTDATSFLKEMIKLLS